MMSEDSRGEMTPGVAIHREGITVGRPHVGATEATWSTGDLERLFREHYSLVYRAAYRVTGNAGDAEDVLQTVFLRLARRESDADALEHPERYLCRAAVNAAVDLMRSRQSVAFIPLEDVAPQLPSQSSLNPIKALEASEIRQWLRKTVAKLSPRSAEIFALRFFEGKSNGEIARAVGTTEGTIAVTVHRLRERIQKEFRSFVGGQA